MPLGMGRPSLSGGRRPRPARTDRGGRPGVDRVATHKCARLLAKDPVTSPPRAPFTAFKGTSAPAELQEEPRGTGLRKAVGELIVCPFRVGQWVATGFVSGLVLRPRATRLSRRCSPPWPRPICCRAALGWASPQQVEPVERCPSGTRPAEPTPEQRTDQRFAGQSLAGGRDRVWTCDLLRVRSLAAPGLLVTVGADSDRPVRSLAPKDPASPSSLHRTQRVAGCWYK
jgi:Protein of unknown function (DUF1360)